MTLVERRLRFSSPVLCAGPAGVFFAYGLAVEGNAEAGLARVRAMDAGSHPLPFTVLVDLRHVSLLRRICTTSAGSCVIPVGGETSISGCDEDGHLMLRVQSTLEIEHDSLGVLVLVPGPAIPWSLGVPPDRVGDFLAALDDCTAGAALAAVA